MYLHHPSSMGSVVEDRVQGRRYHYSIPNACRLRAASKNCEHIVYVLSKFNYTPGIYAEGYIVFVFPFVRSYVRSFVCSFVLPSVAWNLRQSFALKFLKWCISQQLLIRKHSYLDHSYPGGLAFTP